MNSDPVWRRFDSGVGFSSSACSSSLSTGSKYVSSFANLLETGRLFKSLDIEICHPVQLNTGAVQNGSESCGKLRHLGGCDLLPNLATPKVHRKSAISTTFTGFAGEYGFDVFDVS